MDKITSQLVDFALSFSLEDVSAPGRAAARRHLVDTVACAIAGFRAESAQAAIQVAQGIQGDRLATIFGTGMRASVGFAAMANTIMVRTLDWNDGMLARGGGHPSDMIPGVVGVGESVGASGTDVLTGVIFAYEVLGSLGRVANAHPRGWDQGLFMGPAVALAAGRLYSLSAEELANAVSLSIVPMAPLLVTRRGSLSMWKGAATSVAVMHGVHAAWLAGAGMTGPGEPFSGTAGVFDQVTGRFELVIPANPGGQWVTEVSHMKPFPAESHGQALLSLVPEIRQWAAVDEIESIDVDAYLDLYNAIGRDPSCWDPHTRETADHSLPYLLAVTLVDGELTLDSFSAERIADPALRPVMAKVRVTENKDYTAAYRRPGMELAGAPQVTVRVRRRDGAVLERELTFPKGHSRNPMTDADVNAKFDRATRGLVSEVRREAIRTAWWGIEDAGDIRDLTATLGPYDGDAVRPRSGDPANPTLQ